MITPHGRPASFLGHDARSIDHPDEVDINDARPIAGSSANRSSPPMPALLNAM